MTVDNHLPSHPSHSSRSLPLALQLGIRIMSTSMVTLAERFSTTRPETLLIFDPKLGFKGLSTLLLAAFEDPGS